MTPWIIEIGIYFGCGTILVGYLWFICNLAYKDWLTWVAALIAILLWPIVAIDMIINSFKRENK